MKALARRVVILVCLVVLAVAAGTAIPRPLFAPDSKPAGAEAVRILVLSNPIHTDIAIPLNPETRTAYGFLGRFGIPVDDPAAKWMVIGWGGRAFYLETPTWADLKPMPLFRALTVDRSVMHVDVAGDIDETHPAVKAFDLKPDDFQHLSDFVLTSFTKERGDVLVIPDAGYGPYDRFFEAGGLFNALIGCNTWTARALRAAGLRTGLWNPMPQTLAISLSLFN